MADQLAVYLQDHFAGSMFGLELVERCRRNNAGTPFHGPLNELASEIRADRRTLGEVMASLGADPSLSKVAFAWALEKVRRLKPNGSLRGYTPLARVTELETLAIGVVGKREMWTVLAELASAGHPLETFDFAALAERAEDQLRRVEIMRLDAARLAFPHDGRV